MRCRSTGKVMHRNRESAEKAITVVGIASLNSYKCTDCHRWHIGNSNRDYDRQARISQLLAKGASDGRTT